MARLFDDPLNDLRISTIIMLVGALAPLGALIGGLIGMAGDEDYSALGFAMGILLSISLQLVTLIWWTAGVNLGASRLGRRVDQHGRELVTGAVVGSTVPARLHRRLRAFDDSPGHVVGQPTQPASPGWAAVALAPEGPRLVGMTVPRHLPQSRGTSVPVMLHPDIHDVGVLDARVPQAQVAKGDHDPRWSGRLPGSWWNGPAALTTVLATCGSVVVFVVLTLLLTTALPG